MSVISVIGDARFENQRHYCNNNSLPFFANRFCSHNVDWGEGRYNNDEKDYWRTHITDEQSMSEHIVSCPVCHKSFCD